jgi:hypothetical protein
MIRDDCVMEALLDQAEQLQDFRYVEVRIGHRLISFEARNSMHVLLNCEVHAITRARESLTRLHERHFVQAAHLFVEQKDGNLGDWMAQRLLVRRAQSEAKSLATVIDAARHEQSLTTNLVIAQQSAGPQRARL